jgi:anthranilate phosphoribosyltransferase
MGSAPLARAIERLEARESLSSVECEQAVATMLEDEAPGSLTTDFLTALHKKGQTAEELLGAVTAIRKRMIRFDCGCDGSDRLDTCGTGGDGAATVNVSTAAAIVVAACGVRVVKHGNRAATGSSGSSDVLDRLGVTVDVETSVLRKCLDELGIAFLFAPSFHPGLQRVAAVRRQLPFRTIFNLVGPLCNPACPTHQLLGAPSDEQARVVAEVLSSGESVRRAVVVTGSDGLDEVTLDGPTRVRVVEPGTIRELQFNPGDFGLPTVRAGELRISGPEESAYRLQRLLAGEPGPVRSIVLANAAAALWTLSPGALPVLVARAARAIDSQAAARLLERWCELTREGR